MITAPDRQILDLFATRVREHFPEARIWAFGSRARGDATWESDLDVCVVVETLTRKARDRIWDLAWEVGFAHGMVITAICFTTEEFEQGPMSESTLVLNILREGVAA